MADWPPRTLEIQSRYFRRPPYAHLFIKYTPENSSLYWCFTFMDLGMCHTLNYTAKVVRKNGTFFVNQESWPDETLAMDAVFDGHYRHFLVELYEDLGIPVYPENDGLKDALGDQYDKFVDEFNRCLGVVQNS